MELPFDVVVAMEEIHLEASIPSRSVTATGLKNI